MSGYDPEREKARRDERRRLGICTTCGKRPAFGRFVSCEYCIEKQTLRAARWREENRDRYNERGRVRRLRQIEAGKCPQCHKFNPDRSWVYCPKCRQLAHARYVRAYVRKVRPEGVCLRCDRQTEPGFKLCPVHRQKAAAAGEKGRAAQGKAHPWRMENELLFRGI